MAQVTALSPTATPGLPYTFVAKATAAAGADGYVVVETEIFTPGTVWGETYVARTVKGGTTPGRIAAGEVNR